MPARPWLPILVVSLLVVAPALPSPADDGCKQAIAELCPGLSPDTPELRECVRAGVETLPPECRARMKPSRGQLTAGMEALRAVCGTAIDEHCDAVQRGGGRLQRCLRNLDDDARGKACGDYLDALAAVRAKREAARSGEGDEDER